MSSSNPIGPKKPEYTSLEKYLSSDIDAGSTPSTEGASATSGSSKIKHLASIVNTKLSRLGHLVKTIFQPGKHTEWVNDKEIFGRLESRIQSLEEYKQSGKDFREDQIGLIEFIAEEITKYKSKTAKESDNFRKLDQFEKRMETFESEINFDTQKMLADSGNQTAQRRVGMMYLKGVGVEQSGEKAAEYLKPAATAGDAVAQYNLGKMYRIGKGVEQSFGEAFKYTMKAARQGLAAAQNDLGAMYKEGIGVNRYREALKWFQKAADQGNAAAQYNLAKMYKEGVGVERSNEKAFEYIKKAAVQGFAAAESTLGEIYLRGSLDTKNKDWHEAARWFRRAAAQDDANAHYYLGEMYKIEFFNDEVFWNGGWNDLYRITADHFQKAAEGKHGGAQYELGTLYLEGIGVDQSDEKALEWFKKAAENENLNENKKATAKMWVLYVESRILALKLDNSTEQAEKDGLKVQAEAKIQEIATFLVNPDNKVSEENQGKLKALQTILRLALENKG